jgi:phage terminase large subunit-like protein
MQEILKNPEITVGIFSHTRPIAKAFLRQIMREFEMNKMLQAAFPDVLWGEDTRQAQKWSEDDGIIVRRKSNPNEATVEAWGLVDGQPTSKHFQLLNYDDVVTEKSVTSPEMIAKTTDAVALSFNLGARGGAKWFTGTYYHYGDSYFELVKRGAAVPRIYAGSCDGTEEGAPVLLTQEQWDKKRREMGPYIFSCQMLLKPVGDMTQGFKREWLRTFKSVKPAKLNWYLLVDAASSKKRGSDYTSMWAVGLGVDGNYYAVPEVRDRLNLQERSDRLFALHRKYRPLQVRYERYGLMADIDHLKMRMETENYRFTITEVGGLTSKSDRIKRLVPLFYAEKVWLPQAHYVTDWQKIPRDLTHEFIEEEYAAFPVAVHDDMLDALARICEPDLKLVWPKEETPRAEPPRFVPQNPQTAWMA